MDVSDLSTVVRNHGQLATELLPAVADSTTKSEALHDDSSVAASPGLTIRPRLRDEPVQLSCSDIILELSVPFLGIELCKPGPKNGALWGRQLLDRLFNFLDSAHIGNIAWPVVGSNVAGKRTPDLRYFGACSIPN